VDGPIDAVRRALDATTPEVIAGPVEQRAAVAMVLRDVGGEPSLLFIQRAESDDDHWSGHLAFPGGRVDPTDASPRHAAERELREEVGLAVPPAVHLGRVDDLRGRSHEMAISAFVYGVEATPPLRPNYEVAEAFWVGFSTLTDPARHVVRRFQYLENEIEVPAIDLLGPGRPVLWGLSYRFLEILLGHLGHAIPPMPWRTDL
jgi:8-oxo-dGTP pyrophosphatase MutT (NUDIX family)